MFIVRISSTYCHLRPEEAGFAEIGFDAPPDCLVVELLDGLEPVWAGFCVFAGISVVSKMTVTIHRRAGLYGQP